MKSSPNFLPDHWFANSFNSPSKNVPWWVEVYTIEPECLYYFGPFESFEEARKHQPGYIKDLFNEKAQGISCQILQIEPQCLTIFEEEDQSNFNKKAHPVREKMFEQFE